MKQPNRSDSDVIHELKQKVKIAELQNQLNELNRVNRETEMLGMLKEIKDLLTDHREKAVVMITDEVKHALDNFVTEITDE